MKENVFYHIVLEGEEEMSYYFLNENNAIEWLWNYYLDRQSHLDEPNQIDANRYYLTKVGEIPGVGGIWEEEFEDFDDS